MKEEKFLKLIEEIKEANEHTLILVEGRKDVDALRKLGFFGEIAKVNDGSSLSSLADQISKTHKKVIILTDWDKKGKILEKAIFQYLHALNTKSILKYKRKLEYYSKKEIKSVEEVYHYAKLCEEHVQQHAHIKKNKKQKKMII